MNSSKHLLFGLLVLVLGLLAIATYQWLGAPKLEVVAEETSTPKEMSDESASLGLQPTPDPSTAEMASTTGEPIRETASTSEPADGAVADELASTSDESDRSADDRIYAAVAELEDRLRGYIDDAVERASEQSQTPSVDELGEQVAARVMASIREEGTETGEVERINALAQSDPPATIDAEAGPIRLQQVHFLHDSADLTPGAQRKAREAAEWFQSNNPAKIRVVGFSDTRGDSSYNLALSQRRADSVAALLVRAGIPEDRLVIEGLGESGIPEPTGDNVAEPLNRCVGIMAIE